MFEYFQLNGSGEKRLLNYIHQFRAKVTAPRIDETAQTENPENQENPENPEENPENLEDQEDNEENENDEEVENDADVDH